ncbi:uncharacterized protein LACBIDRAFT_328050 [Laccaria bicolor S238N-H82]|uniref:Predicted protein n=1 Tax=Laccaria bicolor (strain S238N-H82 / ATCC MYA-4686) TaxID=486041 RepID=B0DDL3_LACBS|nr:uncharacterized protein LACBIDRAFT_328050 [Laccaria bicolor S238N-H82]EDR07108.1 predicted protein [Laccaria bicolor S238N-H82]|eukprot:XP_001882039.1 predicted protein [Laccaria bicolor S238N-H82]
MCELCPTSYSVTYCDVPSIVNASESTSPPCRRDATSCNVHHRKQPSLLKTDNNRLTNHTPRRQQPQNGNQCPSSNIQPNTTAHEKRRTTPQATSGPRPPKNDDKQEQVRPRCSQRCGNYVSQPDDDDDVIVIVIISCEPRTGANQGRDEDTEGRKTDDDEGEQMKDDDDDIHNGKRTTTTAHPEARDHHLHTAMRAKYPSLTAHHPLPLSLTSHYSLPLTAHHPSTSLPTTLTPTSLSLPTTLTPLLHCPLPLSFTAYHLSPLIGYYPLSPIAYHPLAPSLIAYHPFPSPPLFPSLPTTPLSLLTTPSPLPHCPPLSPLFLTAYHPPHSLFPLYNI